MRVRGPTDATNPQWANKPHLLVLIMTLCVATVTGATLSLLYEAAFQQQKMRLIEVAQSRAKLIQSVARFDAQHSQDAHPDGAVGATLSQIREAHQSFAGFGETGEFTLGTRLENQIVFLLSHRHDDLDSPRPVLWDSSKAEPMRRALQGHSGTLVGLDYRGEQVLAAHEPLPFLGWGIVAKIDLAEIRRPFIQAGLYAMALAISAIALGAHLFFRITNPIVAQLAERESSLASIIDTAVDGIICIDRNGIVQVFNAAAERIFGHAAADLIGNNVNRLMPEPESARHDDHLKRYLDTGEHAALGGNREVEGLRKDGSVFPLQLAVSAVRDRDGHIVSFTGIARDITQEKALQNELRQHAMVFQCASEAIMIMSLKNEIVQVNPAFVELTGYSAEDVIGRTPDLLFGPSQNREQLEKMKRSLDLEGRWQGDIWARARNGEVFPVWITTTAIYDDAAQVNQYIRIFTDISERKLVEDRMRFLAQHDPLTGLANRSLFEDRCSHALQRAHRNQTRFALLYLDLNRFKPVNDTYGHAVGDDLLRAVAQRLREHLRENDTCARLGGDEFAMVLEEIQSTDSVQCIVEKLQENLADVFVIQGHHLHIGVSIGTSTYPDDGRSVADLVQRADQAMYAIKSASRPQALQPLAREMAPPDQAATD